MNNTLTAYDNRMVSILEEIRPVHKRILLLRYNYHMSYDEMASALQLPISEIRELIFQARKEYRRISTNRTTI